MKYRDPSGLAPEKEKYKDEVMDLTPAQLHFAIVRSFELAYAIMHEPTLVSWINHMRTSEYDIMVMGKEYCPDTSIYGMVRTGANGVEYVYDDFYGWVRRDAAGRSGSSGGADNGTKNNKPSQEEVLNAVGSDIDKMRGDSKANNKEYGGVIYKDSEGNIKMQYWEGKNESSMGTTTQDNTQKMIDDGIIAKEDIIGFIHTHPNDSFYSRSDINWLHTFSSNPGEGNPAPQGFRDGLVSSGTHYFVVPVNKQIVYGVTVKDSRAFGNTNNWNIHRGFNPPKTTNPQTLINYGNSSNLGNFLIFKFHKR